MATSALFSVTIVVWLVIFPQQTNSTTEVLQNLDGNPHLCPPGLVLSNSQCVCGDWPKGKVLCDDHTKQVQVRIGYCMTYDSVAKTTNLGACLQGNYRNKYDKFYYSLPSNVTELNEWTCGPFNSKGLLCGECKDGFAAPPFTYTSDAKCTKCTDSSYGWAKYLTIQFLPCTVAFIVMVVFGTGIVIAPLNALLSSASS